MLVTYGNKKQSYYLMKDFTISTKIRVYSLDESDEATKNLIAKAKEATQSAYAPYSTYHVGAAVLLSNGETVCGSNQENAAYPSGLCAERTALFYANASQPEQAIEAIAIIAYHNGHFVKDVCTPCGSCRQVLAEVESRYKTPIRIIMCSRDMVYEVSSIKDLLPLSFDKEALK